MIRCRVFGHRWVFSEWVGNDRVWRFCSRCYLGGLKSVDRIECVRRPSSRWRRLWPWGALLIGSGLLGTSALRLAGVG